MTLQVQLLGVSPSARFQHQERCHQQQLARLASRMPALTGSAFQQSSAGIQTERADAALVSLPLSASRCCHLSGVESSARLQHEEHLLTLLATLAQLQHVRLRAGNQFCSKLFGRWQMCILQRCHSASALSGGHTSAGAMHCVFWPCMPHLGVQIIEISHAQPQQLFTQACALPCHISRPHALLHHSGR